MFRNNVVMVIVIRNIESSIKIRILDYCQLLNLQIEKCFFHYSGYDQEHMIEGQNRSQCRTMAELALREAGPLDNKLCNLLARRLGDEEGLKNLKAIRLVDICTFLFLLNTMLLILILT